MANVSLRLSDELYERIKRLWREENEERERRGHKQISLNAFINSLLMDAVVMREERRKKKKEEEVRDAERRAVEFVKSVYDLKLLSLLGYDGIRFEEMR